MKELRKILISIVIIIAELVAIDVTVGFIGEQGVKHLPDCSGQISKDNYRLNRLVGDVIFVGSSRTSHHYVIPLLQDSVGVGHELYNAGVDGCFLSNSCCVVESILQRGTPNLIVFEANDAFLMNTATENITRDYAFYTINPNVKRYIDELSTKQVVAGRSSMYRYNAFLIRILKNILQPRPMDDGYEPLSNVMTVIPRTNEKKLTQDVAYSDYIVNNFCRVLSICKEKGVNLVVVSSPHFGYEGTNPHTAALCAEYGIPFIDMQHIPYFNQHPELFQDASHLNDTGARLFSSLFYPQIKPYIP